MGKIGLIILIVFLIIIILLVLVVIWIKKTPLPFKQYHCSVCDKDFVEVEPSVSNFRKTIRNIYCPHCCRHVATEVLEYDQQGHKI